MAKSLLAGTRLGRYEIRSKLGEGGMGEVYLAQDTKLDRKVALKILPADVAAHPDRMKRFVQEAKAASGLNHPNIITIYEVEQIDSVNFIGTEFIDGETLRERMRTAPMKLAEILDVAAQVASALSAAHAAGIVHRDNKPENVMLRRDGIVKVLDFGLAKLTERLPPGAVDKEAPTRAVVKTDPGMVLGTAIYMSPEQARGLEVDARTDIFSFGVLIYEMVAGCLPFEGSNTNEIMASILSDQEPVPLARYAREVPAEVERIVAKALRKNRDERYQTIKDLLLDLKTLRQELAFAGKLARSMAPKAKSATITEAQTETRPAIESATRPTIGERGRTSAINISNRGRLIAVALLIVSLGAGAYIYFTRGSENSGVINSVAVLPFANTSNDPNAEYLSDGISEALINSLTELQQLRVVARTTAFRYKGKEVDPQTVGRELNVRAVLMGRVRQIGDTLNIQVDLVDATTGAQLWGAEYERKVSDVLAIKQTITREVTEKLRLRLSGEEQQRLVKRDTTNAEAYQFYLRGRYFWNKRTADGIKKATEQFQQAIDRDPNYALGYVGLADCYVLQDIYDIPTGEALPKARAAADRALQLDNSLAEAHASSALIYQQQWRWAEAGEEYQRALTLNPNYPTAHQWFANYLRNKGQFDDAMREIKRAEELDPLSPIISINVANIYLIRSDLNLAIKQCQRIIELDPSFSRAYEDLGWASLKQRRYEEATAEFQKAVELSGRLSIFLSDLGYCFAVTGRRAEALAILKELEERYGKRAALGQYLAGVYVGLGDKDQAFAWLEKDFEQRRTILPDITWRPGFEDLRGDPRYADLVRRMGLKP
jgi:serine/threonine protein kinase/tetratricopeptide (TPR) repeat protein